MHTYILALETSSSRCSVGLLSHDGSQMHCAVRTHDGVADHTEKLLPMVEDLLVTASLHRDAISAVAFGQGPGAFTGLRVACGLAQGMAMGLGIPVIPVPSLLAVAAQAHAGLSDEAAVQLGLHVVIQDARMGEAYVAAYRPPDDKQSLWQEVQSPMLIDCSQLVLWMQQWLASQPKAVQCLWLSGDLSSQSDVVENLLALAPGLIIVADAPAEGWVPDACVLATLAWQAWSRDETVAPEDATPLYVRNKVAFTIEERKHGAGGNPRAASLPDVVQPMLPVHTDAVASIEARVQAFPWSLKNFQDCLNSGYPAWVSMRNGEVTGYAMVMMAPDVAHLLVIGVDPSHQGRGTGRLLLEYCEAQARNKGLSVMVLEVRQSNRKAIGFYQHMGYEEFSVRKGYYPAGQSKREDASAMKKSLSSTVSP